MVVGRQHRVLVENEHERAHAPVGELVEPIDFNDSQALSDGIDELRPACHDAAVPLDGVNKTIFFSRHVEYG
jgi:hypothetical protein